MLYLKVLNAVPENPEILNAVPENPEIHLFEDDQDDLQWSWMT